MPEYDKNKDTLTVTMNTKQLKENVDFIVSDDGKNIIAKNNIKCNSTGYGATFTFIVEKPKIDDFIDVMYIAKRVLKDLENYKQVTVASYYNISIDNLHRAMGDCKLCSAIYECLQKDILEKWGAFNKFYKKYPKIKNKIENNKNE